eukprot:TRINITY_DN3264_c0_g3_i5.p1 TRINITY_DN3264_c0_g3~~TRINITY_DN3264_c0_g3_i5.p1  ORF type:complete len:905 (+),score=378.09 TRINITY_DN3264_c0_g3_i5:61-2775(+)
MSRVFRKASLFSAIASRPVFGRLLSSVAVQNQQRFSNLYRLINAYREHGHRRATLDPLGIQQIPEVPELNPELYGVRPDEVVTTEGLVDLPNQQASAPAGQILQHIEATYCRNIGAEFMHLQSAEERAWFARALEGDAPSKKPSPADRRNIHSMMVKSETFDHFMQVKFGSFKRYGLEGAESMIPAVNSIFTTSSQAGVENVVLCMPHRGRLNLLVTLLDYPARALFAKVKGLSHIPESFFGDDDVASHIALSVTKKFDRTRPLHVSMLHNPSHLEAINPVALGKTRAKQDGNNDPNGDRTVCVQLHGDAAFAGQGVVPESLLLANLPYYTTGGTVHMIVNNQIGYTTLPRFSRSSNYSSDVGKMIGTPVIHVNADAPEDVVHACSIATQYRNRFRKDVIIDLIGWRKYGHNEVDEPSFTQPLMYQNIRNRKSVVHHYTELLKQEGLLPEESLKKLSTSLQQHLESELKQVESWKPPADWHYVGKWKGFHQNFNALGKVDTGYKLDALRHIGDVSVTTPENFTVHPRLVRSHVEARKKMMATGQNLDWATAEALAFGSLLQEGYNMRISGQDVQRGTFSQRHGVFTDQKTEETFTPLNHIQPQQGKAQYCNSPLSEFAVMGYEYGYSWEDPNALCIWEAQFGDFFNGAQIIIDTFLSSGETKWLRSSGLVLLLPHGYDGAGPEHSSSRVERFLQLCADDNVGFSGSPNGAGSSVNMVVANPTTPANYFHLLRRQMKQSSRKPLVVIAPKTLLRHPAAVSALEEMGPGTSFQTVIGDTVAPAGVKKVVVCSGKVWYDLDKERRDKNRTDLALIRLEQLSPFPYEALLAALTPYAQAQQIIYFQEEHSNAGAYSFVAPRLAHVATQVNPAWNKIDYIGRGVSAPPATGIGMVHKKEVETIMKTLFA